MEEHEYEGFCPNCKEGNLEPFFFDENIGECDNCRATYKTTDVQDNHELSISCIEAN